MLMTTNLKVNDQFPDIELPDHRNELTRLSQFTKPGLLDQHLGFLDGYPLILVFFRGFFCPRDQQQMRQLVEFQHELNASRQALRKNDTMGKSVWKIEEKEGTYDSPNHFTPSRYNNPC